MKKIKIFFYICTTCITTILTGCQPIYDRVSGDFIEPPNSIWEKSAYRNRAEMKRIIKEARKDIPAGGIHDYHVHIVSDIKNESHYQIDSWCEMPMDSHSFINPKRYNLFNFKRYIYTKLLESAGRIRDRKNASYQYASRLLELVEHFNTEIPEGGTFYLMAHDGIYDMYGNLDEDRTDMYVSNEFAIDLADCLNRKADNDGYGEPFVAVLSINPERKNWKKDLKDAVERFKNTHSLKDKPIFMKWLPNSMEFNPRVVSDDYFLTLNHYGIAIIGHTGDESTLGSDEFQHYGSPDLYSTALKNGTTLLMAHAGRDGENKVENFEEPKKNFDIFLDNMKKGYEGQLFGEMSALLIKSTIDHLKTLASEDYLKGRLVNGSDYPIPGVRYFEPLDELLERGWITKCEKDALEEFYKFNPLLFDFLVKRTVKWRNEKGEEEHFFPAQSFGSICDQPWTISSICTN